MPMASSSHFTLPKPVYLYGASDPSGAATEYADLIDSADSAIYNLIGTKISSSLATSTPTASKIPIADGSGTLNSWVTSLTWVSLTNRPDRWVDGSSGYTTLVAAVSTISSTVCALHVYTNQTVAADLTLPETMTLVVHRGAVITVDDAKTLTINGTLEAGLHQIFDCVSTGKVDGTARMLGVHPQWFGAAVDGTTDDSAALDKSKVFAVSSGSPLILPVGTTVGTIALLSTDDGAFIKGAHRYNSVLTAPDNSTAVISTEGGCYNWTLEDFQITNTKGNNNTHYGVGAVSTSGSRIRRVFVSGFNVNFRFTDTNDLVLDDCEGDSAVYSGSGSVTGYGLFASIASGAVTGLRVLNSRFLTNDKDGIRVLEGEDDTFININCLGNGQYGLAAINTAASRIGPWISNSFFDSQKAAGLYIEKAQSFSLNGVWVSSSVSGSNGYGVHFKDVLMASINGLHAYNNVGHGVYLESGCQMNKFNSCDSNSNGTGGTGAGFYAANTNWGNTFNGCSSWNNPTIGFHFLDTTAGKPNIICGCYAEGNTGGQYVIQSKDLVSSSSNSNGGQNLPLIFYHSNLPDGTAASAFYAVPNTDQTVFVSPFAGSLTSISLTLNDTRAAGTLNCRPTVNGTSKDNLKVVINGTNPQYVTLTALPGSIPIAAGDLIGVYYDSDSSWDTTGGAGTVDALATVTLLAQ